MATLTIEHPERIWQLRLVMLLLVIAGSAAVWFVLQWKTAEPVAGSGEKVSRFNFGQN